MDKQSALDTLVRSYLNVKVPKWNESKKIEVKSLIIKELNDKPKTMKFLREGLLMTYGIENNEERAYIETNMLFTRYDQIQEATDFIPKSAYSYVIKDAEWDSYQAEYGVFLAENTSEEAMEDGWW